MSEAPRSERDAARAERDARSAPKPASFGNISEHHWSRARAGSNEEALEYLRARSHAPGVAEGGAARNYYCMQCDGVIAFDFAGEQCPHCQTPLAGQSKRYFNWVEINEPAKSDFKALAPMLGVLAIVLLGVLALALWWWTR